MIYVHVPFCRSFCTYCGFYSEVASKCDGYDYISALEKEIRARQDSIHRVSALTDADTLYIGGGTPSLLSLDCFERMVKALGSRKYREFTVEVNPEDIVEKGTDYVEGLLELGVNRVSMGVQSFDDTLLKWMNRRHTAAQAKQAYRILEEAGVKNISIDLIFGLPRLTESLWRDTLSQALSISSYGEHPRHISAYQLSVEDDSMLERMIAKGMCSEASEEVCHRQYTVLCEVLADAGYTHYEVSNFALPGSEAVHNSAYWSHVPYVGLGPGAHSYDGQRRQWNVNSIEKYMQASRSGDFSTIQEEELLSEEQMRLERIMLGLRTSDGLPEEYLRTHCRPAVLDQTLLTGALVKDGKGNLRIPEDRFFISDNIISSII